MDSSNIARDWTQRTHDITVEDSLNPKSQIRRTHDQAAWGERAATWQESNDDKNDEDKSEVSTTAYSIRSGDAVVLNTGGARGDTFARSQCDGSPPPARPIHNLKRLS